jgi:aminoglycoside phosphotransferase family enzyme/predicted kinase
VDDPLLRPDAWAAVAGRHEVRRVETHASRVYLCGAHAFKVLRPVGYGFLDYTSLAERERVLALEHDVNRRFTPSLYVGVRRLSGSAESPGLSAEGPDPPGSEPVLVMHRFPDGALLSERADAGTLTDAELDEAADRLAAWQREARPVTPDAPWGRVADVRAWMDENFEALDRLFRNEAWASALGAEAREDFRTTAAWYGGRREAFDHAVARRRAAGLVREAHGDLHLGNMVRLERGVRFFDAIAFNESLRWLDPMSELAFPLMDLADRGLRPKAWRLLNRVLHGTGDYDGLAVLPDFLAYRALVRAKVTGLQLAEATEGGTDVPERARAVGCLLADARRAGTPGRARLWITHGLSGSGKSTGAARLAETEGLVWLRSDVERKRLAGLRGADRAGAPPGEGLYTADATDRTYARLRELAGIALEAGYGAVVDATFLRRADRDAFAALARERGADYRVLAFTAPVAELERRLARRSAEGRDPSDADAAVLRAQTRVVEPPGPDEPVRGMGSP